MTTQLEADITIGGTDRSAEIGEFVIKPTRNKVKTMATYGDANENEAAGLGAQSVTVTCKNELAAASFARQLYTAILTDDAQLAFVVKYDAESAKDADNPEWTGNMVVTEVKIGTKVGEDRVMTQTFPVNSLAIDTGA